MAVDLYQDNSKEGEHSASWMLWLYEKL